MISWIQRSFQNHFRIIFAVLLAVTIISFIVTIGAAPGIGRADHSVMTREFFGYNLASREDMQRLMNDASLSTELQRAGAADSDQIKSYALQRAAALHLADNLHLPPATAQEMQELIQSLPIFAGEKGSFDAKRYADFRESIRTNPNISESDIARVIADDVRVMKVETLLQGPGYVLTTDVKNQLVVADTTWTVTTATVDYAKFNPSINPTEADLDKFYQDNVFRYQIPARIEVETLDFPATSHLGESKLTDAEIRAYYDANPARFPNATKGSPAVKVDPNADFAAVRSQVEAALRFERAQRLAAKDASDIAFALYEAKIPDRSALGGFLSAHNLKLTSLPPFSEDAGPPELGGSPEIAAAAFKLDAQHFYSEGLQTPSGAAILIWKNALPPRTPLLAEVKSKVQADYTENEKRKRFVDLGRTLKSQIEAGLKAGKPIDKAIASAASAESVTIDTKTLPSFTLRTRPKDLDQAVVGALEHLDRGQISEMVVDADKGTLIYAGAKKIPDLNESNPQFAQMRASIAASMARSGPSSYLGELVSQELKRTEPVAR